jgi:hypothetical protein
VHGLTDFAGGPARLVDDGQRRLPRAEGAQHPVQACFAVGVDVEFVAFEPQCGADALHAVCGHVFKPLRRLRVGR